MSSLLTSLQNEVADCLLADPFFAAIPVLVELPRDAGYELQRSAAAAATYGVVLVPQAQVSSPTAPGPVFDPVEIAVRFFENVPVSTGPHALEVAETALALLHLFRPTTINEVITAAPVALKAVTVPDVVAYEIHLRTQAGASYSVPQLGAPGITAAGSATPQTVGLSSGQPGAAIYYTLDGSQPAPRGATSMLYSAPFVISEPCLLRARAWLAGFVASAEARMSFS
ncbi:MAG: chitobiase/beta-hexosaminidase C-terminal domain-containing protein [Verrucomicrobiota bacterium]